MFLRILKTFKILTISYSLLILQKVTWNFRNHVLVDPHITLCNTHGMNYTVLPLSMTWNGTALACEPTLFHRGNTVNLINSMSMEFARHKFTYFWCWAGCSGETRGGLGTRRFWRSSTEGGCITWKHLNTTRDDGIWNLNNKRDGIESRKYTLFKNYSKPYIKRLFHMSACLPSHTQCWQWLVACSYNSSNKYLANT